jgi:hypothetical protein
MKNDKFYAGATLCASRAFLFALLALGALTITPACAAKKTPSEATAAPRLDESVVRTMIERGRPSETNDAKILAQLAGDWYYTAAFWAAPGAEPQRTEGMIKNEMILEDRFLSSTVLGSLNIGGHLMPTKGQGLLGYDNAKKSFTSVWVDTLTTGMMIGAGQYDKKDNAIKETGRFTNPLTGTEEGFRSELQFTGPEKYKRTIFTIDKSGRETKLMEFDYGKSRQAKL